MIRKSLFNIHLYGGLAAAVFLVLLGVTGSIIAFEEQIEHILHWRLTHVKAEGQAVPLTAAGDAAVRAYPGETIRNYIVPPSPGMSYQVGLSRHHVWVNQYTGRILGAMDSPDWVMRFLNLNHQLHIRLAFRDQADTGRKIVSWASVVMTILLATGLYLWWRLKRSSVTWGASARRTWFDLHNTLGIFSYIFLLALTGSGVVLAFDGTVVPWFYQITGTEPSSPGELEIKPAPGKPMITPDRAAEIAREALPGAAPYILEPPRPAQPYFVRARFPEDRTPGGRSRVLIDPYSGEVLFAEGSRTAPAGARLANLNRAVHTGDFAGMPSKLVMSLASLVCSFQVVSGAVMWWLRIRSQRRARLKMAQNTAQARA